MARPLVIAHRGASVEAPENTLAAFRRARELGVDAIELDVRLTRDGVPVVFHDTTLYRMTGQPGRVADKTWQELRHLPVRNTERIPSLAAVLRFLRGGPRVQIELKRGVRVAPVIRVIRQTRAVRRVIIASFEPGLIREAGRLAPRIPRMLIAEGRGGAGQFLQRMAQAGAAGLSVDFNAVPDRAWVEAVRAHGVELWCWTVNRPTDFRRLAAWGVDGLLTDNPALLRATI